MHPPPLSGGGGTSLLPNFWKHGGEGGGAWQDLNFERGLLARWGVTFFGMEMFFSVITKNLDFEILTNNSVTFKRSDWVKDEKF